MPTSNKEAADIVIGQANFTSNTINAGTGIGGAGFAASYGIGGNSNQVFISDYGNNRVMVYNSPTVGANSTATYVIGQSSLTSGAVNGGNTGVRAYGFSSPMGVSADSTNFYVADATNSRLLSFLVPTASDPWAAYVFGQDSFGSGTANATGIHFNSANGPYRIHKSGARLIISDYSNYRVIIRPAP